MLFNAQLGCNQTSTQLTPTMKQMKTQSSSTENETIPGPFNFEEFNPDCLVDPSELNHARSVIQGNITVLRALDQYCEAKAMAMHLRLQGQTDQALKCEGRCEAIYLRLPTFAKW